MYEKESFVIEQDALNAVLGTHLLKQYPELVDTLSYFYFYKEIQHLKRMIVATTLALPLVFMRTTPTEIATYMFVLEAARQGCLTLRYDKYSKTAKASAS